MGFIRQEYWNGLPFPSPADLPDPGIELESPELAGRFFTTEPPESELLIFLSTKTILGGPAKHVSGEYCPAVQW